MGGRKGQAPEVGGLMKLLRALGTLVRGAGGGGVPRICCDARKVIQSCVLFRKTSITDKGSRMGYPATLRAGPILGLAIAVCLAEVLQVLGERSPELVCT